MPNTRTPRSLLLLHVLGRIETEACVPTSDRALSRAVQERLFFFYGLQQHLLIRELTRLSTLR